LVYLEGSKGGEDEGKKEGEMPPDCKGEATTENSGKGGKKGKDP